MEEHHHEFEVDCMCRVLGVSRSGFYGWRGRAPSRRALDEQRLRGKIIQFHERSDRTYGSPRVLEDLQEDGEKVSRKRVARIMRQNQLFSKHKRKFRKTTDSQHEYSTAPNLLERDFNADEPNRKWGTDITFIPTAEGWLYLAVVLDLFSRRIVGWSMGPRLDKSLVIDALRMALTGRRPADGLLHHSDRGSQYASNEYREMLQAHSIFASMSRKGDCWDNAVVESFFKTLKVERVYHRKYRTRDEAQADIFQYIEVFYNRLRRHSAIGYHSPVDFEMLRVAA